MTTFPGIIAATDLNARSSDSDLLIVQVGVPNPPHGSYIPDAVYVHTQELTSNQPPATGRLPPVERLEALFGRIGYRPDQTVVVCDDEGGGWAGRMAWTLDIIGHSRWLYLNGGLHAWVAEGLQLARQPRIPTPTKVALQLEMGPVVEADEIMDRLDDGDLVIWDCRSGEEFAGLRQTARRNGHIPGAVNFDWLDLMDRGNSLQLIVDAERQLADRGIVRDKEVITHCQTHHRSGLTYMVGRLLNFPKIRAYHGSWSEWGNRDDTPIETAT